jgi:hypothetical protein
VPRTIDYWGFGLLFVGIAYVIGRVVWESFIRKDYETMTGGRYTGARAVRFGWVRLAYFSLYLVGLLFAMYKVLSRST